MSPLQQIENVAVGPMGLSRAAVTAFWGPRLRVQKLASMRRPGLIGTFLYCFIFSLGTSAAPLLLLTVAAAQARPEYGFILVCSPPLKGIPV